MKQDAASGKAHPMALKKELARMIVADFHSADAAAKAGEDWAKQFQRDELPEEVEEVVVNWTDIQWSTKNPEDLAVSPDGFVGFRPAGMGPAHLGIRVDRLLVMCGLADSMSDAARKLKQGAVRIGDIVQSSPHQLFDVSEWPIRLPLRVGKRAKIAVVQRKLSS